MQQRSVRGDDRSCDDGSIVVGWVTRVIAFLAIFGLLTIDGVSIAFAHVSIQDDANTAVAAASDSYRQTHDVDAAYTAAQAAIVDEHNDQLPVNDFSIDDSGVVHLTVIRTATTTVLGRIPFTRKLTEVEYSASGQAATPG